MNFGVCKQCDCLVIPMERLREVCLDQSVVMPQDAAEQGSREASEPNAVRDVMAADRLNGIVKTMEWILEKENRPTRIGFALVLDNIREVAEQLTCDARCKAAK